MEFWIGLLVGIHLGKVVVHHLQDYLVSTGTISQETEEILETVEAIEEEILEEIKI